MTPKILAGLKDNEIEDAIYNCVVEKLTLVLMLNLDKRGVFKKLPVAVAGLHHTWMLEADVNNGGFDQYFYNSYGKFLRETVHALKMYGLKRHVALLEDAIKIIRPNQPRGSVAALPDIRVRPPTAKQKKKLEALDSKFYKLSMSKLRIQHIRSHPEMYRCE